MPDPELHFSLLLQCGGWAGCNNKKAEVIFLFEYWCFGERDPLPQLKLKAINQLNSCLQEEAHILSYPSTTQLQ